MCAQALLGRKAFAAVVLAHELVAVAGFLVLSVLHLFRKEDFDALLETLEALELLLLVGPLHVFALLVAVREHHQTPVGLSEGTLEEGAVLGVSRLQVPHEVVLARECLLALGASEVALLLVNGANMRLQLARLSKFLVASGTNPVFDAV